MNDQNEKGEQTMIDYYLLDFGVGLFQIVTFLALFFSFFGFIFDKTHQKTFFHLTLLFLVLNFASFILSCIWPILF